MFEGYAWYAKEITLDKDFKNKNIYLHLERTRLTRVWVNDVEVGCRDSLTTPHHYDLTPYIKDNTFRLTILVSNVDYPTKGGHLTSPDTQTNWNGIIGEISLHICDEIMIEHIKTYPDTEHKSVRVEITTNNTTQTQRNLSVCAEAELMDISGKTGVQVPAAYFQDIFFPVGKGTAEFTYELGEDAVLWSEYSPVIYELHLTIPGTDEESVTTFGLRDFPHQRLNF